MHILDEEELKSSVLNKDGVTYTVTAVTRTSYDYDEAGLRKALGAKQFDKLTVTKLDKHKLESAVAEGDVDVRVVAQYTTVNPGTRSLRLTRKVAADSEATTP